MKKIIVAAFLLQIVTSPANAEMQIKDGPKVLDDAVKFGVIQSLTVCVQGHMFLVTYGQTPITTKGKSYGTSISTVQIYEERNGKAVPMRCNERSESSNLRALPLSP